MPNYNSDKRDRIAREEYLEHLRSDLRAEMRYEILQAYLKNGFSDRQKLEILRKYEARLRALR